MEFTGLDRQLTKILNLEEGCVFVMEFKKSDKRLEFLYPDELKGLKIPALSQCVSGKAVIKKSPIVLNNFQGEMDVIYLNCLTMNSTNKSIRKMIAYPICLAGEICAVLVVVRKECDHSDLQNFLGEDLVKIKSVVDRMIFVQLAKTA
jgi:hypothetical protein